MPINHVTGFQGTPAQRSDSASSKVTRSQEAVGQSGAGVAAGDKVSFTETSVRLRALEGTLANMPVVDEARVEAIKQAIADGSYQIDANRIADKLIQFERGMFGK
jgi:negative regulator of flagellin synthesis FlgM